MNKVLLINRINTNSFKEDKRRIFFVIGNMKKENTENYLMDTVNAIEFLSKEDIIYKYNGVEILMKEENIPKVNKVLINADIDIYSIYELYDPMG